MSDEPNTPDGGPDPARADDPDGTDADPTDEPAAPPVLESEARLNPRLRSALEEVGQLKAKVAKEKKKRKKAEKKSKGGLGTNRGIETMFRTSYRTHNDLSSLADTKANIMISINGIIISILLASISPRISGDPWLLVPTSVLLVGCVLAVVYAVIAARPRVTSEEVSLEDVRENRKNILFFGNFVNMTEADFVEGMQDLMMDTDRLYTNMIRDLYSLGGVLAKKFRLLRYSYTVFMVALIAGVALFIAVYVGVAFFGLGTPESLSTFG